jgi:hypothetical protein
MRSNASLSTKRSGQIVLAKIGVQRGIMFAGCCIDALAKPGRTKRLTARLAQRINAMNEKSIDQIEEEVLICEISDEAVEAAGTRAEIAGVWTFICTGIQCGQVFALKQ